MSPHSSWVHTIRSLPLYQRHLIMWGGSLLMFLLVIWLWLAQMQTQLSSLSATTPFALGTSAPAAIASVKKPADAPAPADDFFASLKNIGNVFTSFFTNASPTSSPASNPILAPPQQGDELNQYLPYKPFPAN